MKNAVFVVLGSNYRPYQESGLEFINELREQDYNVNIFSVDAKLPPDNEEKLANKISLYRIPMELTSQTLTELTNLITSKTGPIDALIIMDSIHFINQQFGNELKEQMQKKYPHLSNSPVLHFISPECENPTFNGKSLSEFDFKDFTLTSINQLEPFLKNPAPQNMAKLKRIEQQIKNQSNVYNQIQNFMSSPGFSTIFNKPEAVKAIIREEMTKHICKQIDLRKIEPQEDKTFRIK